MPQSGPITVWFGHLQNLSDTRLQKDIVAQHQAMQMAADLFLRMTSGLLDVFGGDVLNGVVFLAIARANVHHLPAWAKMDGTSEDGVFQDSERRPISVLRIADSLGLSYETVRRRVNQLVADGYCHRVGRNGVVVSADIVRRSEFKPLAAESRTAVRALVRDAHRSCVLDDAA